ncbi:MAG: hypothetical protein V7641_5462 [Blastocatellia bacterium]
MQEKPDNRHQGEAIAEGISGRVEKITELKEALKHVRGMSEEMSLLSDLTQEISALRQLLEPHY